MNESRKRLLSQFSSTIFSDPSSISTITPVYKHRKDFQTKNFHPVSASKDSKKIEDSTVIESSFNTHTRSQSFEKLLTPRLRRQMDINSSNFGAFPKPEEAQIQIIKITGLNPYDNETVLKKIAKNLHVVQVNTDFDNVKGICTGSGTISIRSFSNMKEKDELVSRLKNNGYETMEELRVNNRTRITSFSGSHQQLLRKDQSIDRMHASKENFESINTPRYMRPTASFTKKCLD